MWTACSDIEVRGDYAYCTRFHGLEILDISDPDNPTLLSQLFLEKADSRALDISGDYAYVAQFTEGLKIIDISDPSAPVIATEYHVSCDVYGDANNDGLLNLGDAIYLVNHIFNGGMSSS